MEPKTNTGGRFSLLLLYVIFSAAISNACEKGRNVISASQPVFGGGKDKNYSTYERSADGRSAGIIHNSILKGVRPFAVDSLAAGRARGFYTKHFATALKDPHIFAGEVSLMKGNLSLSISAGCSNAYLVSERGRRA